MCCTDLVPPDGAVMAAASELPHMLGLIPPHPFHALKAGLEGRAASVASQEANEDH